MDTDTLTKKVGPLPLWGWAVGAAGAYYVFTRLTPVSAAPTGTSAVAGQAVDYAALKEDEEATISQLRSDLADALTEAQTQSSAAMSANYDAVVNSIEQTRSQQQVEVDRLTQGQLDALDLVQGLQDKVSDLAVPPPPVVVTPSATKKTVALSSKESATPLWAYIQRSGMTVASWNAANPQAQYNSSTATKTVAEVAKQSGVTGTYIFKAV